jgi:hypothetical protein
MIGEFTGTMLFIIVALGGDEVRFALCLRFLEMRGTEEKRMGETDNFVIVLGALPTSRRRVSLVQRLLDRVIRSLL